MTTAKTVLFLTPRRVAELVDSLREDTPTLVPTERELCELGITWLAFHESPITSAHKNQAALTAACNLSSYLDEEGCAS